MANRFALALSSLALVATCTAALAQGGVDAMVNRGVAARMTEPSPVASGARIAKANCGGCHATAGKGPSPLADAPPFRRLHERYGPGGLDGILQEGMLAGRRDESGAVFHPRMPSVALDLDQVADLKAYLHSLEPVARPPPKRTRRAH